MSKLLEKHIANILLDFLYSNSIISPNQFGFLPSRSTTDTLIAATQAIQSSLDHSTPVCGVFLDIRKAFDSVSHSGLLHKLSSIGLPSHLYSWFCSYLANRTQSVKVGNSVSSTLPVLSGVPQGSILGPLLFILYINDIPDLDPEFLSRMFIYADDILLLHPISSTSDIFSVNSQLQAINLRLSEKSLKLNTEKSKYMIFSFRPQAYFDSFPPVMISDITLERVYSFKYLGLLFKPNLSWSSHIQNICKKAKKVLGLIYRHFYLHCTSSTLLTLYFTLVRPILEYCSVIWDPSSLTTISALESVQCFALKLVSKSWSTDYNFLLSSLNITTLAQRRRSAKILIIFKLKNHLSHSINSPLQSPPLPSYFSRNYSPFNLIPIHFIHHQSNFGIVSLFLSNLLILSHI